MDVCNDSWMIAGHFNCPLNFEDRIGRPIRHGEIDSFRDFLNHCGLKDMSKIGCFFTWSNKQGGDHKVMSKIDRVLVNKEWMVQFPTSYSHFKPEGWLDHCPAITYLFEQDRRRSSSFKFYDMWGSHPQFQDIVKEVWSTNIRGCRMFQVVQKLKLLKHRLKALHRAHYSAIETRFLQLKSELDQIQVQVHQAVEDVDLRKGYSG